MKVRVMKTHLGEGEFPVFAKGSFIELGEENSHFPGWLSCEIAGYATYVPDLFVSESTLNCDYNPTELVAEAGEVLEVKGIVYSWLLAVNAKDETGWIPAEAVVSESI